MGGLGTAITDRFDAGDDDRVGIVEYALMIALVAVVATVGALLSSPNSLAGRSG